MREAVLDVGSNTAHLLVVDAHRGAAPLPALSVKRELRLAEHLTPEGALSESGVDALVSFIAGALVEAEDQGCESVTGLRHLGDPGGEQHRRGRWPGARSRPAST